MKDDAKAKAFVIGVYKQLKVLQKGLTRKAPSQPVRRYKHDFAMTVSMKAMFSRKLEETRRLARPAFEQLLSEFCLDNGGNEVFPAETVGEAVDALLAGTSSNPAKVRILGSDKTEEIPSKTFNSPIIILTKESSEVPMEAFVDMLHKRQERSESKYEIIGEHYCHRHNYLTRVPQLVISDFLYSLGSSNREVAGFLSCIEYNVREKVYPEENVRESLPLITEELFALLNELDLDYNLIYIIQNAEYLDEYFFKFMRRYKSRFPKYLKLVLTVSKSRKGVRSMSMLSGSLKIPVVSGDFVLPLFKYTCSRIVDDADEVCQALLICTKGELKRVKRVLIALLAEYKGIRFKKAEALELVMDPKFSGEDVKVVKIKDALSRLSGNEVMEQVILFLIEAKAPICTTMLQSWVNAKEKLIEELAKFSDILTFDESPITANTIVKLNHKRLWKKVYKEKIEATINKVANVMVDDCWTILENETIGDMPVYYHFNAVYHYLKIQKKKRDNEFVTTKWLYSQIEAFNSFDRIFADLDIMLYFAFDNGLNLLKNHMHILENIYMGKKLAATEFVTQLQSRLKNEAYPSLQPINGNISSIQAPYFNPMHSVLKENNNLEHVLECDSPVTAAFLTEDYMVYATEECLLYIHMLATYELAFQYLVESGVSALCYTKEGKFLIGGSTNLVLLWSIKGAPEENPVDKLDVQGNNVKKIIYFDNFVYLVVGEVTLCKCTVEPLEVKKETEIMEDTIVALEVTRAKNESYNYGSTLVIVGLSLGSIFIFDSELENLIKVVNMEKGIVSLHALPKFDDSFISVSVDGDITMYSNTTIAPTRSFSIFRVDQEELQEVFVQEDVARIFSVENNVVRIYNWETRALIDEWLYTFKSKIRRAAKSPNNKFLLVADTQSRVCLFNIQKELRQRYALKIPSHKRQRQISFILSTRELSGSASFLITCSAEREIKVWQRDNCEFVKKFNLSSVASSPFVHRRRHHYCRCSRPTQPQNPLPRVQGYQHLPR